MIWKVRLVTSQYPSMDQHIFRVFTWIRSHKFVIDVNIFFVMINPDKLFIYVINVQLYIIHDMCRTRLSKEIIIIIDMTKEIIYRLVVLKKCHEQCKFPFFCVCFMCTCAVSHSKEKQSKVSHCTFSVVKKRETMHETTNLHVCSYIFFSAPADSTWVNRFYRSQQRFSSYCLIMNRFQHHFNTIDKKPFNVTSFSNSNSITHRLC